MVASRQSTGEVMALLKWMLKLPVTSAESGFCPRSDENLIYSLSSLRRRCNGSGLTDTNEGD